MLSIFFQGSLAFSPPQSLLAQTSSSVVLSRCTQPQCAQPLHLTRRVFRGAATACRASSASRCCLGPQAVLKSRAIYGSRVFRLQNASPDVILDEKGALTLFITGCYSTTATSPCASSWRSLRRPR